MLQMRCATKRRVLVLSKYTEPKNSIQILWLQKIKKEKEEGKNGGYSPMRVYICGSKGTWV